MKKFTLMSLMAAAMVGLSANGATVYWDNTDTGWDTVIAYSWSPDVNESITEVVNIDGHELYKFELGNEYIIFKGAVDWSDPMQTANLVVADGRVYGRQSIKSNGSNTDPVANIVDGKWVAYEAPVDEYPAMYLVGGPAGWSKNEKFKMSTTDGKSYTLNNVTFGEGQLEFKFFGGDWGTRELRYPGPIELNEDYEVNPGDGNTTLAAPCENVNITLVCNDDYTSGTLRISGEGQGGGGDDPIIPGAYRDLYLVGSQFGSEEGTPNEAYKFSREGNVYTITLENGLQRASEGETWWKIWDGTWAYNFGAGGEQPELSKEYECWFDSYTGFTVTTEGKTTITFTLVEGSDVKDSSIPSKLLIDSASAVESVEVAEVEDVRYFNLQGVEVSEPANGIFVRVADGKATKVVK